MPELMPEIRIIQRESNMFTVMCGDRYENQLCHGEVLDVVARVFYRSDPNQMRTREDHQRWADSLSNHTAEERARLVEP